MQKNKKLLIGIVAVIITLIAIDLSPFGGSAHYYTEWLRCGHRPVRLLSKPGLAWYETTNVVELARFGYQEYKCTPLEAEQAGYSASSSEWSFPHLHPKS